MGEVSNTVAGTFNLGVIVQGEHVTVRLPVQLSAAMAGLPAVKSSFTGREEDLRALLEVLAPHADTAAADSGAVLVSAVGGMGGVGKTALAVRAARTALERGWFPGGVLFVDMFGYDPERALDVDAAVAGFLRAMAVPGEHIPADPGERLVLYRSVLEGYASSGRPVLVFIANVAEAGQALALLPGHGACRAVVTSRERLAGLDARLIDLDALPEAEAVALLANALHTRLPDDTRLADEPDAARELAGLCAGLPLALQIAAALLAGNPHQSAAGLADILRPTGERLSELRDHRGTLHTMFDLSYQRLPADRQRLFALLPVGHGSDISTTAAAALADLDPTTTRRILEGLAGAHLVEPAPTPPGGEQRWRMHDLLRLYARHLPDTDRGSAHTRLLDHYQTTAELAAAHLRRSADGDPASAAFPDRGSALAWLDAELDNLAAAITAPPADDHHREFARDLPLTLADYLAWRRHFNQRITLTTVSLQQAEHFGDLPSKAAALNNLGSSLREVRRFAEAIEAHQQDVQICREAGDRPGEGTALNNLGLVLRELRRFAEAIEAHQQDVQICQEIGDRPGEGMALNNLGLVLVEVRQFSEAIDAYRQAAAIYREIGDRYGEGGALNNLGLVLVEVGRSSEAIDAYRQAAAIFQEAGDRYHEGGALNNLGLALRRRGRLIKAGRAFLRAWELLSEFEE
ncbi:tetratricopeptide repeat protein [Actinocorallia libanotica]|uniref:AfsR-like transcriptional regulator TcrA n=1 Tax=Actinocorallia libanotica TaxID=46162 RepID=A0ABP4CCQ2_9ACTN